jgi:superfamily I DNA/RNA helicase
MNKLMAAVLPGDFVLSRVNAPLVSIAMSLLKRGTRTVIAGRDVGKGLQGLITKFKAKSIPDLMAKIANWEQREIDRITKRYQLRPAVLEQRIEAISDQADMLTSLAEGAASVYEVTSNITALFSDSSPGAVVTCSSVHRAKGLEAERVYVLADTLRSNTQEEVNITYVAITRAKKLLTYVAAEDKPYADKNEGW